MGNLLNVWSTVGSVALAVLMLLVMITVHEFGHYIAGKILHFKIDEFSIGFGPALFKRRSKKSGELFALRLIPLGGYCAFAGEDGLEEDKKKQEKEPFDELKEENAPQEGAAEQEKTEEKKEEDKSGYFTHKKPWQRIIVLLAGAFMNYVLAVLLIITCFFAYGQTMNKITGIALTENSAESTYSFQEGDVLLKVAGRNIYMATDIASAINYKKAGDMVEFLVGRDGKEETITVMLREDVVVKNSSAMSSVWKALGVGIEEHEDGKKYFMLTDQAYRFGFFETLGRSFAYSGKIAGSIFRVLGELLTGKIGISSLGGPVTTITTTSKIVSMGFRYFLEIAGFIGVNLAVFNLLPIPALDGSKVVFTLIEWVRGKPISRKVEAIIHGVGFLLLLGFAVLVDILQFVL